MIEWILVICTNSALGLCGQYKEVQYPTEKACYRALDELYKRHSPMDFRYVVCEYRPGGKTRKTS